MNDNVLYITFDTPRFGSSGEAGVTEHQVSLGQDKKSSTEPWLIPRTASLK